MPKCKNDPTKSYKGDEPSPKGLGYCAHSEEINKVRKGKDGNTWKIKTTIKGVKKWVKEQPIKKISKNKSDPTKSYPSDLTFWYSDSNKISTINISDIFGSPGIFGSTVLQISSGILTINKESNSKKIGYFTEMKTCSVKTSNTAFANNLATFFLKKGNIQYQPVGIQSYNSEGNYGLPANNTYTFKIMNCTGGYLNFGGHLVIHTFKNLDRLVKIYFDPL
jgi:hypothetical protein